MLGLHIKEMVALVGLAIAAVGWGDMFFPVNSQMFRLLKDDGGERMFARDADEPRALVGEGGWMGELRGRDALLLSADERQGLYFVNGLLRKRLINGRERAVQVEPPKNTGLEAIKGFWPPQESRLKAGAAPDDYWAQDHRLRLWFKNPNLAGGLMALLALFSLGLVFFRGWLWKMTGMLVAFVFLALLIKTESRAAMLAFGFGCGLMALVRVKSLLSWRVWLPVVLCVGLAGGYMALQKNGGRFTTKMFQEGNSNLSRIPIWLEVPRMMADAPWGWGAGESGKAYIRWYQDKSTCLLENLVSGHCTFLVEHGWPMRFTYAFLWSLAFILCLGYAMRGRNPMPLAVVGAFAFIGLFHPVVYAWELWVVPVFASVVVLWGSRRDIANLKGAVPICIAAGISAAFCIALLVEGKWRTGNEKKIPVFGSADSVCVNNDSPEMWIVDDDYVLHGGYWWLMGRELRDWCARNPQERSLGHTFSINAVPASCRRLVIVGERCEEFCRSWRQILADHAKLSEVVLLSPSFPAESLSVELPAGCSLQVIQGGLVARAAGYGVKPNCLRIVEGASLYIPDWLDIVSPSIADASHGQSSAVAGGNP